MFEKIEIYLSTNAEYAWLIILFFAFLESFILSGLIVSSAVLFSICIFVYNTELMPVTAIVPVAVLGAHLGDMTGFIFGKTIGPNIMSTKIVKKRQKVINRAQKFLDRTGSYTVLMGRFIPAIRPIVPFLLGVTDLKIIKFYVADLIACICWGLALGLLVTGIGSFF